MKKEVFIYNSVFHFIMKMLTLTIFLISLLIVTGCNNSQSITITQEDLQEYQEEKAQMESALESQDIGNCVGLASRNKAICIKNIAVSKSDELLCEEIGRDDGKTWGVDQECFKQIAVQKTDLVLCDRVNNGAKKNSCIIAIAIQTKDVGLCEQVDGDIASGKGDIYLCYTNLAKVNGDVSMCDKVVESSDRDWCITEIARSSGNLILCERIEDSWIKSRCVSS